MVKTFYMPAYRGIKQGRIVGWVKQEGEKFEAGECIVLVETEKVVLEVQAPEPGVLFKIAAQEGAVVTVGQPIAYFGAEGEAIPPELQGPQSQTQPGSEGGGERKGQG